MSLKSNGRPAGVSWGGQVYSGLSFCQVSYGERYLSQGHVQGRGDSDWGI